MPVSSHFGYTFRGGREQEAAKEQGGSIEKENFIEIHRNVYFSSAQ